MLSSVYANLSGGIIVLKSFSVSGVRNFNEKVTLNLSETREYRFNESNITNGIISNALIIGRNASGKTNLGVALGDIVYNFIQTSYTGDAASLPEDNLYINADSKDGMAKFCYEFQFGGDQIVYAYEKDAPFSLKQESLFCNNDLVFDYNNASRTMNRLGDMSLVGAEHLNWVDTDSVTSILAYITNFVPSNRLGVLRKLRKYVSGMRMLRSERNRNIDSRNAILTRIIEADMVGQFEEYLQHFRIDAKLQVASRPDGLESVYFSHSERLIPFAEGCSSGTETLLRLFSALEMQTTPSFIYLDEFDAFCHYELAESLISYFSGKTNVQTLCSTHNTSLVKNASMRPDCVFQITPTGIRSLADSTERTIRMANNVEKLLRGGEFN